MNLKFTGISEKSVNISIFDMNGNIAFTKDITKDADVVKLNVSVLSPGSYLLNCKTGEGKILNSISFIKIN